MYVHRVGVSTLYVYVCTCEYIHVYGCELTISMYICMYIYMCMSNFFFFIIQRVKAHAIP